MLEKVVGVVAPNTPLEDREARNRVLRLLSALKQREKAIPAHRSSRGPFQHVPPQSTVFLVTYRLTFATLYRGLVSILGYLEHFQVEKKEGHVAMAQKSRLYTCRARAASICVRKSPKHAFPKL